MNMERSGVEPWVPERLEHFRPEADSATLEVPHRRPLDLQPPQQLRRAGEPRHRTVPLSRSRAGALAILLARILRLVPGAEEAALPARIPASTPDWRNTAGGVRNARCACCIRPCRSSPKNCGSGWPPIAPTRPHIDRASRPIRSTAASSTDHEAEREIGMLQEIVTMARTLRTETKLDPKQQLDGALYSRTAALDIGTPPRRGHPEAGQREARVPGRSRAQSRRPCAPPPNSTWCSTCPKAQAGRAAQAPAKRSANSSTKNIANSERQLGDEASSAGARQGGRNHPAKLADYKRSSTKIGRSRYDRRSCACALEEDIGAGDVTSRCLRARIAAWRAAASSRASRWSSPASSCSPRSIERSRRRAASSSDGDRCADGDVIADRRRPRPHAARVRARRAEFPAAPERRRHAGPPVRRRRGRHRLPRARHAQDHARPARASKRPPPPPAASPTTAWASTTPS